MASVLKDKYGFSTELVKTLVLKHPPILGRTSRQLEYFFDWMSHNRKIDRY